MFTSYIARLILLYSVFVFLNSLGHLFLKIIKLKFIFINFSFLILDLFDLLIQIVLNEVHLEKNVNLWVLPMVLIVEARVIFWSFYFCFVSKYFCIKVRKLWIFINLITLSLIFLSVINLCIDVISLQREASNGKCNEVTRLPTQRLNVKASLKSDSCFHHLRCQALWAQ